MSRRKLAALEALERAWGSPLEPAEKAAAAHGARLLCVALEDNVAEARWSERLRAAAAEAQVCTQCFAPAPAIRCGSARVEGCGALLCTACALRCGRCPFCSRLVVAAEVEAQRWMKA